MFAVPQRLPLSERPLQAGLGTDAGRGPAELTCAILLPFSLRTEWARATPWCDTMMDLHPEVSGEHAEIDAFIKLQVATGGAVMLYIITPAPPPSPTFTHPQWAERLLCIFT